MWHLRRQLEQCAGGRLDRTLCCREGDVSLEHLDVYGAGSVMFFETLPRLKCQQSEQCCAGVGQQLRAWGTMVVVGEHFLPQLKDIADDEA
jgi:hypothetical protein